MHKYSFLIVLLLTLCGLQSRAQLVVPQPSDDSSTLSLQVPFYDTVFVVDSTSLIRMTDSLQIMHQQLVVMERRIAFLNRLRDSLVVTNDRYQKELEERNQMLEDKVKAIQEKEHLVAEKEQLYKEALSSSTIDKAKFESEMKIREANIELKEKEIAMMQKNIDERDNSLKNQKIDYEKLTQERDHYIRLVDSLRAKCVAADMENLRKQEENKYLMQKAKDAEERAKASEATINAATNRKKKVRPVQGIAMRFFRTPDWELRLDPYEVDGTTQYHRTIRNKNAGNIEFDYVTGASVMLWDMSKYFNSTSTDSVSKMAPDIRKFDQEFAYDLGVYVGFGGSNLFKNFYAGPSFRFVDFFYLTAGVNICEYETLDNGIHEGDVLPTVQSLDNVISKKWLVKPFVSLSIDLDFLSYIKK